MFLLSVLMHLTTIHVRAKVHRTVPMTNKYSTRVESRDRSQCSRAAARAICRLLHTSLLNKGRPRPSTFYGLAIGFTAALQLVGGRVYVALKGFHNTAFAIVFENLLQSHAKCND